MSHLRIIVCPHELAMGGSQINAIELASQLRRRGHDVIVFAPPGPLSQRVAELGLEHIVSPDGNHMSWRWMQELGQLAKNREADIVHAYEWAPSLGAAYRLAPRSGTCLVMTVLSMDVPDFLPRHVPLIVGTRKLLQGSIGRSAPVYLMEPPIDTDLNSREAVLVPRRQDPGLLVSMICRVTDELDKAAGILQAIQAVEELSSDYLLQLVVAGDGDAMDKVTAAADATNSRQNRILVRLLGDVKDPRELYAISDISLGMGSSALKAMAFETPIVVQGSSGYWKSLTPESLKEFEWQGFYGEGGEGTVALRSALAELCGDPELRRHLGSWGRQIVENDYSLCRATDLLEKIYRKSLAANTCRGTGFYGLSRSAYDFGKFQVAKRIRSGVTP